MLLRVSCNLVQVRNLATGMAQMFTNKLYSVLLVSLQKNLNW